jgi:hypothetical protein
VIGAVSCVWIKCAGKIGKLNHGRRIPKIQSLQLGNKGLNGAVDAAEVNNQVLINHSYNSTQRNKSTMARVRRI